MQSNLPVGDPLGSSSAAPLGSSSDWGRVDYNSKSKRAYAVTKVNMRRWYIGVYATQADSEAAAISFLLAVQHGSSDDGAAAAAALAQKAARHACLGTVGFDAWRGVGRERQPLYIKWNGSRFFLGSFSAEMAARAAMDAFLSVADTDVQNAVAAAKQVAIEEQDTDAKQVAVEEQDTDAALRSSYITPCPGYIPGRQRLRLSFDHKPYDLGKFLNPDAARLASLLFMKARATRDLKKIRQAVDQCLELSANHLAEASQPSSSEPLSSRAESVADMSGAHSLLHLAQPTRPPKEIGTLRGDVQNDAVCVLSPPPPPSPPPPSPPPPSPPPPSVQVADDHSPVAAAAPTTRLASSHGKRPRSLCEPGTDDKDRIRV